MGEAFLHGNAGISGSTLTVNAPAGSTVTISKDGKSKTKTAANGVAVFKGLENGDWLVAIADGASAAQKTVTVTRDYAVEMVFSAIPEFTYTGEYQIVNDADEPITASQGNWKIRFLTSGTLTFTDLRGAADGVDVFVVGAGGGSPSGKRGGSGGGRTATEKNKAVAVNTPYQIVIGAGTTEKGGTSSAFDVSAEGGDIPEGTNVGGNGGSGGGACSSASTTVGGNGGSDGGNGEKSGINIGGIGQGTTTREFGEPGGKLYAGGGGGCAGGTRTPGEGKDGGGNGGNAETDGTSGAVNTGGGAGGSPQSTDRTGGSGIIIIRNRRAA